MKPKTVNGMPVPYDMPFEQLKTMLLSSDMQEFCLSCEALSELDNKEAYEALKPYLFHKDKYRRLYVLKVIFKNSLAREELLPELEKAVLSEDIHFVNAGLRVALRYGLPVSQEMVRSAVKKHFEELWDALEILSCLDVSEENFVFLAELLKRAERSHQAEVICDILCKKYAPTDHEKIFDLLSASKYEKLRLQAVKWGLEYGLDVSAFENDKNGHIRKLF